LAAYFYPERNLSPVQMITFTYQLRQGARAIGFLLIGIVGTAVLDANGQVANFNYISSLNFRISREIKGCSNCMINEIIKNNNSIYNTLLISPPGMRKDDFIARYNTKY
jgi:stage III sporulation protein AA